MPAPPLPAGRRLAVLLLPLLSIFAGCTPVTVSFTLGADPTLLFESTVARDEGPALDKVAIIDVRGLIADSRQGIIVAGQNPLDEFIARLNRARNDPRIRAVIIRINSPGGTVTASDILYEEITRFRLDTGKPVIASLGDIAASGGYYIALAADEIIAQPTSITGSIGVIIPSINIADGLARIGVRSRSIVSRPNKDLANPLEPVDETHYAILQRIVDEFYDSFRALVLERRPGIRADLVDDLTDGRIVTGVSAREVGLVDATGGIYDAFEAAKRHADIRSARLVKYEPGPGRPRTPYAISHLPPPRAADTAAGTQYNLVQVNTGWPAPGQSSPGVYYLWLPPID